MQESIPKEVWIWLKDILFALASLVVALLGLLWRSDRKRLSSLEEKVAHAITRPEVEKIVEKVVTDFSSQHSRLEYRLQSVEEGLKDEITGSHNSLKSDLGEVQDSIKRIYEILTRPYNGNERRKE